MRLRYLQALRAVMEAGTVTDAAMRLHRTQPQVSRLIANLEDELGFKIFARHKRRLVPTMEGRTFYREAERILAGFDEISNIIRNIRRMNEPRLRILAQPFLVQTLVPEALAAMVKDEPDLRYSVDIGSRADIHRWFTDRAIDIGIAALPIGSDTVRTQAFADATVVALVPRGHRLAKKNVLDACDIANEPFIGLEPHTLLRKQIDRLFSELGLHLNIRAEVSSGVTACHLVAQGLGVTISDPLVAKQTEPMGVVVREWRPSFALTYGFLFPEGHEPSTLSLRFAELTAAVARKMDPAHVTLIAGAGASRAVKPQRTQREA